MAKMKALELEALLGGLQEDAGASLNSTIGKHRADLMRRYLGLPYGDEVDGRSKVVDTSIRDVIEAIKPELMDIFIGGDKVVEFVPKGEEDIEAAQQETDACNHIFMQQNDGFMILYGWFTDALTQKNGYVKRYWDERQTTEIEEYDDLTPEEAGGLLSEIDESSDDYEVLERSGGIDEETGEVTPMYIKVRRTSTVKKYTIENIPPEEVLVYPKWTHLHLRGCPFVAHKRPTTVSDLLEMGFDKKQVSDLPSFDKKLESEEAQVRFGSEAWTQGEGDATDESMREVMVYENYILCDYDGDGIAEQLQVFTGSGGEILRRGGRLAIEQVTDAPFECMSPLPIPHRHYGLSKAELVDDLQRTKTVLSRQMIDNTVQSNNPDWVVDEDRMTSQTVQDLSETGLSRVVRIPGGMASASPAPIPQTAGQSLQAIEYVDSLTEKRTGVTRYNQGLDANSLNKTATGVKTIMSASQKKILMDARVFAETGYKYLFVHMHRDLRAGPIKELMIKLNNKYVSVNPRTWKGRTDVAVNVGLGTGDRDVQIMRLQQILQEQKEAFASGLLGYEHVYSTYKKIIELSGWKDVANFFPDPAKVAEEQKVRAEESKANPPPDPGMMLAQIELKKVEAQERTKMIELDIRRMEIDNRRLEVLMKDDRERDLQAAKIEADEAARMSAPVDGQRLTSNG